MGFSPLQWLVVVDLSKPTALAKAEYDNDFLSR